MCDVSCSSFQPHCDCEPVLDFLQQVGHCTLQQAAGGRYCLVLLDIPLLACMHKVVLLIPLPAMNRTGMRDLSLSGKCV